MGARGPLPFFLVIAVCRWGELVAGASLTVPAPQTLVLPQPAVLGTTQVPPLPQESTLAPLVPQEPAITSVPVLTVPKVNDLIEDPAFIEELIKNIYDDLENDTDSVEQDYNSDDITDDQNDKENEKDDDSDSTEHESGGDRTDSDDVKAETGDEDEGSSGNVSSSGIRQEDADEVEKDDKINDKSEDDGTDDDSKDDKINDKSEDDGTDDDSKDEDIDDDRKDDLFEMLNGDNKGDDSNKNSYSNESSERDEDNDNNGMEGDIAKESGPGSGAVWRYNGDDNDLFDILFDEGEDWATHSKQAKGGKLDTQSGECPVYPINIEESQITINTQDGCQIVIELTGRTVKHVSTVSNGKVQVQKLLQGTKVSFLKEKNADTDETANHDDN